MRNQKNKLRHIDNPSDKNYWNDKWKTKTAGWDIGYASPPIMQYMQQYPNKEASILIPGCGNAYEAEQLIKMGFNHITLIDIAPFAVENLKEKFSNISSVKILCEDFFNHPGKYDLMIEQTFFCALLPIHRKEYAAKASELLNAKGKIIGLLFNRMFDKEGPPFGGTADEYKSIFKPSFEIKTIEACHNSIPPRAGSEVFIILNKK